MLNLFSKSERLHEVAEHMFNLFVAISVLDFAQGILFGPIRALNRQKYAIPINFVTYYIFVLPLAILFTFHVRHFGWVSDVDFED